MSCFVPAGWRPQATTVLASVLNPRIVAPHHPVTNAHNQFELDLVKHFHAKYEKIMNLISPVIYNLICLGFINFAFAGIDNSLYAGGRAMDPGDAAISEEKEVLVRFKQGFSQHDAEILAENLGLLVIKSTPPMEVTGNKVLLVVKSKELTGDEVISLLRKQPEVDHAEINVVRSIPQ